MKKPNTAGKRPEKLDEMIKALRKSLSLNQQEFANLLGVNQQTVSAWERGEDQGGYAPSAETLIRIGNLAPASLCMTFWQRAGVDLTRMRGEVQRAITRGSGASDNKAESSTPTLPLLRDVAFGSHQQVADRINAPSLLPPEKVEAWVPVPWSVAAPKATVCLRADDDFMQPMFRAGDVVVVAPIVSLVAPRVETAAQYFSDRAVLVAAYNLPTGKDAIGKLCFRWVRSAKGHFSSLRLFSEAGPRQSALVQMHVAGLEAIRNILQREGGTANLPGEAAAWSKAQLVERQAELEQARRIEQESGGRDGIDITGNSEWSIVGHVIAWIGSIPESTPHTKDPQKQRRKTKAGSQR